jgi:hypothetical protein
MHRELPCLRISAAQYKQPQPIELLGVATYPLSTLHNNAPYYAQTAADEATQDPPFRAIEALWGRQVDLMRPSNTSAAAARRQSGKMRRTDDFVS